MGKPISHFAGYSIVKAVSVIAIERKPRELKYLSTWRKRNRRDSLSSDERKRKSPNPEFIEGGCRSPIWDC